MSRTQAAPPDEGIHLQVHGFFPDVVYTWWDMFEGDLLKIKTTDLIEHGIDLIPGAVLECSKTPLYTEAVLRFANKLIP